MEVRMDFETMKSIVSRSVFLGMMEYRKLITPDEDKVRKNEAERFVRRQGYQPSDLERWVADGYVHRRKQGDAQNSPVIYSILEILRHINAVEMQKGNIMEIYKP